MNHVAVNSPAVGSGPGLGSAQCSVHLLSDPGVGSLAAGVRLFPGGTAGD